MLNVCVDTNLDFIKYGFVIGDDDSEPKAQCGLTLLNEAKNRED